MHNQRGLTMKVKCESCGSEIRKNKSGLCKLCYQKSPLHSKQYAAMSTTSKETTPTTNSLAQRKRWRKNIGNLPNWHFLISQKKPRKYSRQDQPPVIYQASFPNFKHIQGGSQEIIILDNNVKNTGTQNCWKEYIRAKIENCLRIKPLPFSLMGCK